MDDNEINIEKGIPIPPVKIGGKWVNLLRQMKVGDSFVTSYTRNRQVSFASIAKRVGIKITTRKVSETELRVWRIE